LTGADFGGCGGQSDRLNRTVVVFTHVVPFPPAAGNEIRILKLIAWLRDEGYQVILALAVTELQLEVARGLCERVDDLVLIPRSAEVVGAVRPKTLLGDFRRAVAWRTAALRDRLNSGHLGAVVVKWMDAARERLRHGPPVVQRARRFCSPRFIELAHRVCAEYKPTVVIAEYIFFSECLAAAPAGALKVIDTIDMFSLKQSGVVTHGVTDPLACTPAEERQQLLRADVIIAIQEREARLMAELVPERSVINVGIDFEVAALPHESFRVGGRVLVVGSDNPLNVHGLREFIARSWPRIREICPGATLRVVGKLAAATGVTGPGIEPVGWVEDLWQEYAAAEVVVNCTIAGTGLKIKTVEALCHGKALVAWPNGVDGLACADPPAFHVASDWEGFAAAVAALLRDPPARAGLEARAIAYARTSFERHLVYALLREVLRAHVA